MKEAFSKYGKIKDVIVKHSYAFINFEDHEAAVLAVAEMNGKTFINGEELFVEQSGREKKTLYSGSKKHECSARRKEKKVRTTEGRCLLQLLEKGALVSLIQIFTC